MRPYPFFLSPQALRRDLLSQVPGYCQSAKVGPKFYSRSTGLALDMTRRKAGRVLAVVPNNVSLIP